MAILTLSARRSNLQVRWVSHHRMWTRSCQASPIVCSIRSSRFDASSNVCGLETRRLSCMWCAAGMTRHRCKSLCEMWAIGWRRVWRCPRSPSARALSAKWWGKNAGVCKLFQTETTYALLGNVGSADRAGRHHQQPAYVGVVVHREVPQPCVAEGDDASRDELLLFHSALGSPHVTIQNDRGDKWTNLMLSCGTQEAAGCKTKSLLEEGIAQMLNMALACGRTVA